MNTINDKKQEQLPYEYVLAEIAKADVGPYDRFGRRYYMPCSFTPVYMKKAGKQEEEARQEALETTDPVKRREIERRYNYLKNLYQALRDKGNRVREVWIGGKKDNRIPEAWASGRPDVYFMPEERRCPIGDLHHVPIRHGEEHGEVKIFRVIIPVDFDGEPNFAIIDGWGWKIVVESSEGDVVFSTDEWLKNYEEERIRYEREYAQAADSLAWQQAQEKEQEEMRKQEERVKREHQARMQREHQERVLREQQQRAQREHTRQEQERRQSGVNLKRQQGKTDWALGALGVELIDVKDIKRRHKEIKKKYMALCRKWHPDRCKDQLATTQMQIINDAYGFLSDLCEKTEII